MARGITQSDIDRAADLLLLQGERPTVDRIRQHLGTGSPNTVTRLLDVWWKALGKRLSAHGAKAALPDAPASVASLASQLWEEALTAAREHAHTALESERAALETLRVEADARVAAAHQAAEHSQARAEEAAAALRTAHERLEDRQRLVDELTQQRLNMTEQRDQAVRSLEEMAQQARNLRERVDSLLREADAAREAQAAHLRAVEDRAHVEIDRARQGAREREKALQSAERSHATRVRELESELSQSRSQAAQSAQARAAAEGGRAALEQQLADVHRRLEAALSPAAAASRKRARQAGARKQGGTP